MSISELYKGWKPSLIKHKVLYPENWNLEGLAGMEFTDHFLRDLAESWYQVVYPEIGKKDVEDLLSQMSLVSLEDATQLRTWFEL